MIEMKPWPDMTPRERDTLIGSTFFNLSPIRAESMTIFTIDREWLEVGDYAYYVEGEGWHRLPRYTTSLDACRLVLREIERRRLQAAYVPALSQAVGYTWQDREPSAKQAWSIIHATPDQQCQAALRTMGVEV